MKKKTNIANRKRTYRLIFLLVCAFYVITCSVSKDNSAEETMFIELSSQIKTVEKLEISDSSKVQLIKNIFYLHKINIKTYRQIQERYMQDAVYWKSLLAKEKERLEKKQISSTKK